MLRPKKFKRSETIILGAIAALLLAAGSVGVLLGIAQSHWQLALASAGVLCLAALYLLAARRGRPL
jgi:hypothetical protein